MMERISAEAAKATGNQPDFGLFADVAYPAPEHYSALDGNAVLLVSALTKDRNRLPPGIAAVVSDGKPTALTPIHCVLSDQSGSNDPAVKAFGPYRADMLYLLPVRLRMKPGDVAVAFAGVARGYKVMTFGAELPASVARLASATSAGGGPSEGALDRFIRDQFPGVLDNGPANRPAPPSDAELAAITARGKALAGYDHAAWVATDGVAESKGDMTGVTTYVGRQDADGWTVVFGRLSEGGDKFLVVQEAKVKDGDPKVAVKAFSPPREETAFFPAAARALATVRDQWWRTDRQYNFAVIPASSGQIFVYAVPIQTDLQVFPLGGDTRYLVSADGSRILERREMHRAITFFKGLPPGSINDLHFGMFDNVPEDSDVFHALSRKPSTPMMVVTPQFVYHVEPSGAIRYLMTTEVLQKITKSQR